VLATTSERTVLGQLNLLRYFTGQIAIPNVRTQEELAEVLKQRGTFRDERIVRRIMGELQDVTGSAEVGVGIKTILAGLEEAVESRDPPGRFVEILASAIAERDPELR
jgi:vesicle-fusing ATPase